MKYKNVIALFLAVMAVLFSVPVYAADSPVYDELAEQTPVYQREVTLEELENYYLTAKTDEILDPAECNYKYGEVYVGGVSEFCHVYMRTFKVTGISNLTVYDMEALAKRIVSFVKKSSSSKYIKCIAKTYNARISKIVHGPGGSMTSVTVKIFIACGEKTEDRIALRQGYIADIAKELMPLPDGERFLKINELMLDGRFKYDMTLRHRCSAVALVNEGTGVCEEYAGFTSLLLVALGYENYIITGEVGGTAHMWNLVVINGRVYHLDILHNGPVNEKGVHISVLRTYLLVSEKAVTSTHTIAEGCENQSSLAVYDYIFEGYPSELSPSFEYNGASYIFTNKTGVTASAFCAQYDGGEFIRVTGSDGAVLNADDTAGSGSVAEIYVNGGVVASYILCTKGDVDGDGFVTDGDVSEIAEHLLLSDGSSDSDLFLLASDLDENKKTTITDLILAADIAGGRYTEGEDWDLHIPETVEEVSKT